MRPNLILFLLFFQCYLTVENKIHRHQFSRSTFKKHQTLIENDATSSDLKRSTKRETSLLPFKGLDATKEPSPHASALQYYPQLETMFTKLPQHNNLKNMASSDHWSTTMSWTEAFDFNTSTTQTIKRKSYLAKCPNMDWQLYAKLVCLPIFLLFGLGGNMLSFFVMTSNSYKHKSYSYYLRVLAITDSLTLLLTATSMVHDMTYDMKGKGFLHIHTDLTCKLWEFMRHSIYVISSWMVVCFTFDR